MNKIWSAVVAVFRWVARDTSAGAAEQFDRVVQQQREDLNSVASAWEKMVSHVEHRLHTLEAKYDELAEDHELCRQTNLLLTSRIEGLESQRKGLVARVTELEIQLQSKRLPPPT